MLAFLCVPCTGGEKISELGALESDKFERPELHFIQNENRVGLGVLLQSLPLNYRIVVVLRVYCDHSYEEIAKILNSKLSIDYPAVQNRLCVPLEQEAALSAACSALQAQGVAVTARALAQAAGVGQSRAQQLLRQYRDQFPAGPTAKAAWYQQRLSHVAAVCA